MMHQELLALHLSVLLSTVLISLQINFSKDSKKASHSTQVTSYQSNNHRGRRGLVFLNTFLWNSRAHHSPTLVVLAWVSCLSLTGEGVKVLWFILSPRLSIIGEGWFPKGKTRSYCQKKDKWMLDKQIWQMVTMRMSVTGTVDQG